MPAVSENTLVLDGFRDLQRAFRAADRTLAKELRGTLRGVVEPIRSDAERLAVSAIPRIGIPWSRMRIGVTTTSVYLAPRQHGTRLPQRKRPNLAALLLGRSMEPALASHTQEVMVGVDRMLADVGRAWEHA